MSLRSCNVPKAEISALAFVEEPDIRAVAHQVMQEVFAAPDMCYDFSAKELIRETNA